MHWIRRFQLFLFDFDGLLVNTEHLHYQAYVNALAARGLKLPLNYADFLALAHLSASAWKDAVLAQIPSLSDFDSLYKEKKQAYLQLLQTSSVELMPGVEELLYALEKENIRRCVVTHSILEHVKPLKDRSPVLQTIPNWMTRECYEKPKPDPECYLKAIDLYGKLEDRIIGFEDSVRGFTALKATPALAVLVCAKNHPLLPVALEKGGLHFENLSDISDKEQFL
jgi:beta-phosphoglucomutase